MFLLNTRPLWQTKTISDYTKLLFNQFALQHYKIGVGEVHLIFDKPGRQQFNPKQFEHHKRYLQNKTVTDHQHYHLAGVLGMQAMQKINCGGNWAFGYPTRKILLKNHQRLLVAGCFTGDDEDFAWLICTDENKADRLLQYQSNAEADNRVWRHAIQSPVTDIPIYSPTYICP